jgi:two-component system sensor histidine kinase UhpB
VRRTAIVLLLASSGSVGARPADRGDYEIRHGHLKRFAGQPPDSAVPLPPRHARLFDARALARWGIAESGLPPDSTAPSRPPSLWREYGPQVLAAALLLLIAVIVREHRRVARARAALAASYGQLRGLAGRLVTVQEEERRRIARDVHDDIGQRVASLSIALSAAKRMVPKDDGPLAEELSALQQQARKIASDLRRLSHELHPAALEQLGLLEALRGRCAQVQAESGVQIELEAAGEWPEVEGAVALCLYRVAQEALRNVTQHARARSARVSLERRDALVVMRVADDGCGFDGAAAQSSGLGLVSLGERVRLLGGTLEVEAAKAAGTTVTVSLPAGGRLAT